MTLHKNKELFKEIIDETAKSLNLPFLYIEKDYWVSYILKLLSKSKYVDFAIFKGGTSLSKAYKIIDRFSEDIDLAIITNDLNSNQIKKLIKEIEKDILDDNFNELPTHIQVSKGSEFRKTIHDYPKIENGNFGHANESIILELNSFSKPDPFNLKEITPYVYDFLIKNNAHEIAKEYELEAFFINVLNYKRTLCEKISAIARASYEIDNELTKLKEKIRHFYDIHFLMQNEEIQTFINSEEFIDIINHVRIDDKLQFNKEDSWANVPLYNVEIFTNTNETLLKLEHFYNNDFKDLVYAKDLPKMNEIIKTIEKISKILKENNL